MIKILFIFAGILSSVHIYTYGIWLKKEGNIPGSILAFLLASAAIVFPIYRMVK